MEKHYHKWELYDADNMPWFGIENAIEYQMSLLPQNGQYMYIYRSTKITYFRRDNKDPNLKVYGLLSEIDVVKLY